MKFGVTVVPRITDWQLFVDLETMGYDCAWAADSQMLYSDAYATLALAAANTSRIRLGTGVSVAGVRLAPVTAHSIATVNQLAPGRVFLGIGTGHTAMRVMGKDPMKAAAFREYLRVLRALLHGEEVDYELSGERPEDRTDIRFLHPDRGFIDVAHPVPIYVAADGPLALKAAGAYGDGRVCSHNQTRARLQKSLETMQQGAAGVGRTLPNDFHTAALSYACVLRPGESMTSDRVIDAIGPRCITGGSSTRRTATPARSPSAAATCGTNISPSPRRWRRRLPSATSRSISAIVPSCRPRSAASSPKT
jgi:alkanesulfonate monooxygenase SsuD/methylene tetrahydromethanopterin reductase-like flavin-dependent oxidoreductase (luciferase family)